MPLTRQHIQGERHTRRNRLNIEGNVALLVEQTMDRMMEQKQFSVGWDERNG